MMELSPYLSNSFNGVALHNDDEDEVDHNDSYTLLRVYHVPGVLSSLIFTTTL